MESSTEGKEVELVFTEEAMHFRIKALLDVMVNFAFGKREKVDVKNPDPALGILYHDVLVMIENPSCYLPPGCMDAARR